MDCADAWGALMRSDLGLTPAARPHRRGVPRIQRSAYLEALVGTRPAEGDEFLDHFTIDL